MAVAGGGVYRAGAVAPRTLRNYHATMRAIPAIRLFLVLALSLLLSALGTAARAQEGPGTGILLQIDGPIGPATSDFLIRGMKDGADSGASLIVIQMDTPGGLVSSTRDIIKAILGSPVPVATFVAPSGSRAASAGTYILYASHIAAMAPATHVGAATPVSMGGGSPPRPGGMRELPDSTPVDPPAGPDSEGGEDPGKEGPGDDDGGSSGQESNGSSPAGPASAAEQKAVNDMVAYIRSLAEQRGRNADWAEEAVRDGASISSARALELNVIDVIAGDVSELLSAIDGRPVELADGRRVLATEGLVLERIEPDWRTEILSIITSPTVAYLLLLVGIYGLIFEGYNPGAVVPGVVGVICLLLAAYALQVLPVNYAGLALILLGIILMISEAFVPSFGVLGIGGVIAFVVGSVILMDTDVPGFGVPLGLIGGIAAAGALSVLAIIWVAIKARRRPVVSGVEQMIGLSAVAREDFAQQGQVFVHGELWNARTRVPIRSGQPLEVVAVHGLTLEVRPTGIPEN
jgi:membrane-bound serine protease (ClpP class)